MGTTDHHGTGTGHPHGAAQLVIRGGHVERLHSAAGQPQRQLQHRIAGVGFGEDRHRSRRSDDLADAVADAVDNAENHVRELVPGECVPVGTSLPATRLRRIRWATVGNCRSLRVRTDGVHQHGAKCDPALLRLGHG